MRYLITSGFVLLTSGPAAASSPAAWATLEREATRTCIAASEFRAPRVSNPIFFNDKSGAVALLVTGIYPQAHMKGASGTSLCLYDRRSRAAIIEEARGWSASRQEGRSPTKIGRGNQ